MKLDLREGVGFLDSVKLEIGVLNVFEDNRFTLNYFTFYIHIYRSDLQESDGGPIQMESNYPDLLSECQGIAVR